MPAPERLEGDLPVRDAETAAGAVADDATVAVSGFGSVGYPKAVPRALARSDRDLELTVISGGSVGEEIDGELVAAGGVARRYPYQARPTARDAINAGTVAFHDRHISKLADEVELGYLGEPDVAVVEAVAAGEDWLIPSTSVGHTPAYVRAADEVVVEVNRAQPLALRRLHDVYRPSLPPQREPVPLADPGERVGEAAVRFDPEKLTAVVETDRRDDPYEFREPSGEDEAIADNLASFLGREMRENPAMAERVTLQFGVGSLGNALMGALESFDFEGRDVVYFGEVIQDGLLDMIDAGRLRVASGCSLSVSEAGLDRLFDDVERYAEHIVLRNADVSNRPALIDRFGVVAVNTALEVDLHGHANSTHINGTRLVNGIGGSGDFSRNALVGVVALSSTAADGAVSRIVPMVPHVDHTEHDFSVVITEHGVADLRGMSPRERARTLIEECAAPAFRDGLRAYRDRAEDRGGHAPHDLETALAWHREWSG